MSVHFTQTPWQSSDPYMCRPVLTRSPSSIYQVQFSAWLLSWLTLLHLPQGCSAETFTLSHNWLPCLFFFFPVSTLHFFCDASECSPHWNIPLFPRPWGVPRSHSIYSPESQGSSPTVCGNSVFSVKCPSKRLSGLPSFTCPLWMSVLVLPDTPMKWFTLKRQGSGTARQEICRTRNEKRDQSCHALFEPTTPPESPSVHQLGSSQNPWNSTLKHLAYWVIAHLCLLPQILGPYCSWGPWNYLM